MTILYAAHSGWRYIVLLVAALAIIKLLIGWLMKGQWQKLDQGLGAAFPIVMDIQLLMGLILFGASLAGIAGSWRRSLGMRGEHLVIMLLAVIVAHIAWARVKKSADDSAKFQIGAIGFLIAGILLTVGVARITYVI